MTSRTRLVLTFAAVVAPVAILTLLSSGHTDKGWLADFEVLALICFGLTAIATAGSLLYWTGRIGGGLTGLGSTLVSAGVFTSQEHLRRSLPPDHELADLEIRLAEATDRFARRLAGESKRRRQLEAVFSNMREGVMVLDERGRIVSHNPSLIRMCGVRADIVGRTVLEVIMKPELDEAVQAVLGHGHDGLPMRNLLLRDERDLYYDVTVIGLPGADAGIGAVVVMHDISDIKRLEKVRRDFVTNVSHELRTPLTSIKGYSETLLGESAPDPELLREFLEVIVKNSNQMTRIVDELLHLSRLEADGPAKLDLEPVNAEEAIGSAWRQCVGLARDKDIHLEKELDEGAAWVLADRNQLVQVFRNLLENAVKYSPRGETVHVQSLLLKNEAVFYVSDKGPGIPKDDRERVFERFYRVEKHRKSGEYGGTGLGLAICRNIVKNHGGRIWVEDPDPITSAGATFGFSMRPTAPGEQ